MSSEQATWLRLRDGSQVVTRNGVDELLDVTSRSITPLPARYARAVRAIAMQCGLENLLEADVQHLLDCGIAVRDALPNDPHLTNILRDLDATFRWINPDASADLYEYCLQVHARRKLISGDLIQAPCLPETTLRRAELLAERHRGGEVLCIGDDDLVSLALVRLGVRVTVLDAHPELLDYLQARATEMGATVETRLLDVRDPLPQDYRLRFQAVITDPVSSATWLEIWLTRASWALANDGLIYLNTYRRFEGLTAYIAARLELPVVELRRAFSHYRNELYQYMEAWDSNLYVLRGRPDLTAPRYDVNLLEHPRVLTTECSIDCYGCTPVVSWERVPSRLHKLFCSWSRDTVSDYHVLVRSDGWCLQFSSDRFLIWSVITPARQYVGLTVTVKEDVPIHYPWIADIQHVLRPESVYDFELPRYLPHP